MIRDNFKFLALYRTGTVHRSMGIKLTTFKQLISYVLGYYIMLSGLKKKD